MDERTRVIAKAAQHAAIIFTLAEWGWTSEPLADKPRHHIPREGEIALAIDSLARSVEENEGVLFARTGRLVVEHVFNEGSGESDSIRVSLELGEWDL